MTKSLLKAKIKCIKKDSLIFTGKPTGMDSVPKTTSQDGGWSTQTSRKRAYYGSGRGRPQRGRGTFRGNPKRKYVGHTADGSKNLPPTTEASTSQSTALNKPTFKAVAKGEVKSNVPEWVLGFGGDSAKKTLSDEASTLPKSRLIRLTINGIHHNIDVLRLSPAGVDAVRLLQTEIRGFVVPPTMGKKSDGTHPTKSVPHSQGGASSTNSTPSSSGVSPSKPIVSKRTDPRAPTSGTLTPHALVACPTCGFEVLAEKLVPDVSKMSGRSAARKYLNFRIESSKRGTQKLIQARADLEEKFVQQDEEARLRSLALEREAKAKLAKAEAEKEKIRAQHYQDLMDTDSVEGDQLERSQSSAPAAGLSVRISTAESQAIRKAHMMGGKRTAPLNKQPQGQFNFPYPPPVITESAMTQFFEEMRQNMARMEAEIKLNRQEVIEMKSTQLSTSRQGSQTQLAGPLISRIGSNLNTFSIESTVEVMSSTLDQCLSINPSKTGSSSSPDPTSQEVIGQINDLLAESDEDMVGQFSDPDDEVEVLVSPKKISWADDVEGLP